MSAVGSQILLTVAKADGNSCLQFCATSWIHSGIEGRKLLLSQVVRAPEVKAGVPALHSRCAAAR